MAQQKAGAPPPEASPRVGLTPAEIRGFHFDKPTTRYGGEQASTLGATMPFLQGATLNRADKAVAGLDAFGHAAVHLKPTDILAGLSGNGATIAAHMGSNPDFTETLKNAYDQDVGAQQNAAAQYAKAHPVKNALAGMGGGAATIAATGGAGFGGALPTIGTSALYGAGY